MIVASDEAQPMPRQVIASPLVSLEAWGAWIDANAALASRDNLPVIAGQRLGPRQRTSRDELIALVEAPQRRSAARAFSPLTLQRAVGHRAGLSSAGASRIERTNAAMPGTAKCSS